MTLPYDVSRCRGEQIDGEWREGCEDCLRRTEPSHPERQSYITPPVIIVFECEHRLEKNTVQNNSTIDPRQLWL
jgi:hypothetical protein